MSIREASVVQFAGGIEQIETQQQQSQ
jgi:hypothetical protein